MRVYFPIWEEANVREAFAKFHEFLGYPKIVKSVDRSVDKTGSATPDYLLEDEDGNIVRAEAKFSSSGAKGYEDQIDLIVCWDHDWNECPSSIKVLDLSEHVEDPGVLFNNIAIAIIDFLRTEDPSIEVYQQNYRSYPPSLFTISREFGQEKFFVTVRYHIGDDGMGYYSSELLYIPEHLLQKFDNKWDLTVEDLLKPLQEESFTVNRTITGVGALKTTKEMTVSKSHMAKDLMDDPKTTKKVLSGDVISILNFIKKALEY